MYGGCSVRYLMRCKRGSLEEITGKTWILAVTLIVVLIALGPMAVRFVEGQLHQSVNSVSSNFSFQNMIS